MTRQRQNGGDRSGCSCFMTLIFLSVTFLMMSIQPLPVSAHMRVSSSMMSKPQIRFLRGGSDLANSILEVNPDYESDNATDDSDDYSDTDDEDETDEATDSESESEYDEEGDDDQNEKSKLNKALAKSKKKAFASLKVVEQNRTILTILCAIFAFRREIWTTLVVLFTYPTPDGKRRPKIRMNPTSLLKIILFLDFMRKMRQQSPSSSDGQSSGMDPMGKGNKNFVGKFLAEMVHPSFAAYLPPVEQHYTFEKVHERYSKDENAFARAMNDPSLSMAKTANMSGSSSSGHVLGKGLLARRKSIPSNSTSLESSEKQFVYNGTCIILEMNRLDTGVSSQSVLRDQVSFIIQQHRANWKQVGNAKNMTEQNSTDLIIPGDSTQNANKSYDELEIIILLESPGGSAADYGLAASHIKRLRTEPGIKVTICVDKVAASGGYMIACMATPGQLYCAPFAIVGSIGVIGQTLNIHNTLQNWGVKPLVFRGGKDKAPIGLVGEITKEGVAKVQQMVDKTHSAFIRHVVDARPTMEETIYDIATGDTWLGYDALENGLVDRIITSDEYIGDKIRNEVKVLRLLRFSKPRFVFGMPPPAGLPTSFRGFVETMSEFRSILKKINALLHEVSIEDGSITNQISAKALMPEKICSIVNLS